MRIISGIYNRRVLISPESDKVRPTSDRAKETLFNMLSVRYDFNGMKILDLFCGTGNLGLESISRGARECEFVDLDIRTVTKNIELLKAGSSCKAVRSDALVFVRAHSNEQFDLIFCDPPYDHGSYEELLFEISVMKYVLILEN